MGRGGRRGEQQNASDRHALWITLPGDPCAACVQQRGTGTNSTNMSVGELVEEEPKKRITTKLIFSALCVT